MNAMENTSSSFAAPSQPGPVPPSSIYGSLRKLLFVIFIAALLMALVYLVYQNGKSIYANGI